MADPFPGPRRSRALINHYASLAFGTGLQKWGLARKLNSGLVGHTGETLPTLGIGLFISTIANTQQEAMLSAFFLMLPSIFLSGFFFPIAAMPTALQWISYLVPLRYFLIIVRGIVLKGVGIHALWSEVLALTLFAIVIMGFAALRLRKRLD